MNPVPKSTNRCGVLLGATGDELTGALCMTGGLVTGELVMGELVIGGCDGSIDGCNDDAVHDVRAVPSRQHVHTTSSLSHSMYINTLGTEQMDAGTVPTN